MTAASAYTVLPVGPAEGTVVAAVGQPSPSPTTPTTFEPTEVSPGLQGFIPVFLIAVASLALFLSLTRHLRRVTVRQAAVDAREAEEARGVVDGGPGDGAEPGGGPAPDAARPDDHGRPPAS
ncbi:hypothetical protein [uncultured Cellulomonas sp.]|uniref:hypothetical protein n=1 Tax=uncultured Cellulomonas sp. TaxID=189682 RepID=UPI00261BE3F3|nr:hypothetical protein [uncultured Cellulomonas sp.]